MSGAVLIHGARQLLTLRGPRESRRGTALRDLGIIHDGAVLVKDGRIVEVGPSRRVENLAQARHAHEIDATNRVVMPGFVDCHTHLVSGPPWLSEYEARIAANGGTAIAGDPVRHAVLRGSAARLASGARHIVDSMVRHGTTTLEAKSGYGFDETGESKILRVHAMLHRDPLDVIPTFLCPRSMPPGYAKGVPNYLSWICADLLPKIRHRGLARYADCRCDGALFDDAQLRQYLEAAQRLGFQLKVHAGQFRADCGVCLAVALGAVSADHLDHASRADIELLARSNTIAVLLPGAPFRSSDGRYAPARALIDAGAAVALATDFDPCASPTCSMQTIVALACARLRMSPAEAICAATFNAACALGAADRAGSLEVGKFADLIVLNAEDYREIPYYFGVNLVSKTIKRGVTIYQA
jgi:imidazolonepropionase